VILSKVQKTQGKVGCLVHQAAIFGSNAEMPGYIEINTAAIDKRRLRLLVNSQPIPFLEC
jgi:hypothetical protein